VDGHVTAVMHCPVGVDAERVGRDMSVTSISPFLSFSYLSI
jgi:trehalose 6-phosphate synthase/phosphatase